MASNMRGTRELALSGYFEGHENDTSDMGDKKTDVPNKRPQKPNVNMRLRQTNKFVWLSLCT